MRVGPAGDRLELDADLTADRVMRMEQPAASRSQALPGVPGGEGADRLLRGPGRQLDPTTRSFMEPRFGHDFGDVRVHDDAAAARQVDAVGAVAFTTGRHVAFAKGEYAPSTEDGRRLLAHELAHTVQQDGGQVVRRKPKVEVRSPVLEETVTQVSELAGAVAGRPLLDPEIKLVEPVFAKSIDYSRVRLIGAKAPQFVTIGNNIYVPPDFTIGDAYHAQTLIHELVHVWQYQRGGTAYISRALVAQIGGIAKGSRNLGYGYTIDPGASFYDFNPEQQGLIVENYFSMKRDEAEIAAASAAGGAPTKHYLSNHMDAKGGGIWLSAADRLAEIRSELPLHETLLAQVRASIPRPELQLLQQRALEVMATPGQSQLPVAPERQLTPVKPLIEIRF
jgi:hypothetical protein